MIETNPMSDTATLSSTSASWNKRASKACTYCRRDKVKCDGERPCSQCKKRGYTEEFCIDGCESCRKARVTCIGGQPCQRCRDEQIECIAEPSAPKPVFTGPVRNVRVAPIDRVKSACQNCRKDNKKCDDQIPCSRCVARSEDCVHVSRNAKAGKLRCEGCRDNNRKCSDSRPCEHCLEEGKECVTKARKSIGHGARVKMACMKCRRDKIRCEGGRPCTHCTRRGYDCLEPSCRTCNQAGKATECTHRGTRNDVDVDPASASVSPLISQPMMLPPSSSIELQGGSMDPQSVYGVYYYPSPQAQPMYPPQQSIPDTRLLPLPIPSVPLAQAYHPVIDPSLENQSQ